MPRSAVLGLVALLAVPLCPGWAAAGEADVVDATAVRTGDTWRFDVTVSHADEGWEHYADAWVVLAPDGQELARRVLAHPHVTEQPFTRSLSGVVIPDGLTQVTVAAQDSVHGFGGVTLIVPLE
ncbi:MAG: hypothetical protein AAFR93_17615 [Pseudomonadota bacterium]